MQFITDLQLHSKYSRAVSPKMDLYEIARWASKKGIQIVATGDWQHPQWFSHLKSTLVEASPGLYKLKQPGADQKYDVRFLLSSEISSIYSQGGKVRRVHNLIWSPSLEVCEKVIQALKKKGANLHSDGRPIVGISSNNLLEMMLEIDERILIIPAHVWTPWFALFGSMSGFDSIEECFGKNSKYIYGIETGLSSDPRMNWQIKELNNRSILSFSDAHSGPKLGREATVLVSQIKDKVYKLDEITYEDVTDAIKQDKKAKLKIGYTIEFFPEEGKYHWDGHRVCGVRYTPQQTKEKGVICPVCKRPLTIGVESRVLTLADRMIVEGKNTMQLQNSAGLTFVYDNEEKRVPFVSAVPLLEIIMEIQKRSPTKSNAQYEQLTSFFATEFDILLRKPYEEIEKYGGAQLAQGIKLMRERKIHVDPGYDGVFGTVHVFDEKTTSQDRQKKTKPTRVDQISLL